MDSGSLFRFRPWGMWIQGEDMPLEVFNSATVYLKEMRKGGKGNRCHPCLNSIVGGGGGVDVLTVVII